LVQFGYRKKGDAGRSLSYDAKSTDVARAGLEQLFWEVSAVTLDGLFSGS